MKKYNIPIFIPHEGCPHDCVFCNQRKITGVSTTVKPSDAERIIEEYLGFLPNKEKTIEAAFFGGSFTGLPLELQEEFYRAAAKFRPQINGIRLSTRPDYINDDTLELAEKYGVTMIELGAQSASDKVLSMNNRGHTFEQTCTAVEKIKARKIGVGLQMMTGMYGSTAEVDILTAKKLTELKPDCARIYPVLVLKDTALEKLYLSGEYTPLTLEKAVEVSAAALEEFDKYSIPVIRIGLHIGGDLREPGNVAAGPLHPALGELIEGRVWRSRIEKKIQKNDAENKNTEIRVPKCMVSKAVGHKRCNLIYFKEKYGINIKIIGV